MRKLQLKKKSAWRIYKRFRTPACLNKFNNLAAQCRAEIQKFTLNRENAVLQSTNLGRFFQLVNSKFNCKTAVGPLKNENDSYVTNPTDKATLFQNYFSSVFNIDNGCIPPFTSSVSTDNLPNYHFSPFVVKRTLYKLNSTAKGGPDQIPRFFLRSAAAYFATPLSILFQLSTDFAFLPPVWLLGYITPIFKKGDRTNPKNYRLSL
jgi:hypothetical protein